MFLIRLLCLFVRLLFTSRKELMFEVTALRQQLAIYTRVKPRPPLNWRDRLFWVALSRVWSRWREALCIVKPETVVRWHRAGWRLYWRWKSRPKKNGRPSAKRVIRNLVRRMAEENPTWGAPRIHGELLKLGIKVAQSTVSRYMPKRRKPASETWRTFLKNQAAGIVACDFFTVPTITFGLLYGFVFLRHSDRRIVHIAATAHPSAQWVIQQIREAFPFDEAPRYLLRDRDSIYSKEFSKVVKAMSITDVKSAWRSPWQNPYCERVIGTIRRECLDHIIPINMRHLRRTLRNYQAYYNGSRTHLSLNKDAPNKRPIEPFDSGAKIISIQYLGGLHHRYARKAA